MTPPLQQSYEQKNKSFIGWHSKGCLKGKFKAAITAISAHFTKSYFVASFPSGRNSVTVATMQPWVTSVSNKKVKVSS